MVQTTPSFPKTTKAVQRVMNQAQASFRLAPDGAAVLIRKAVQLGLSDFPRGPRKWDDRIDNLLSRNKISSAGARAAKRAVLIGNWGAHQPLGVRAELAVDAIEYGKLFLAEIGHALIDVGEENGLERIRRQLEFMSDDEDWEGVLKFDGGPFDIWFEGAMLEMVFACKSCGAGVYTEDVDLPPPNYLGDGDSMTYGGSMADCELCGTSYTINTTNTIGGWDASLEEYVRELPLPTRENRSKNWGTLPPRGSFAYRSNLHWTMVGTKRRERSTGSRKRRTSQLDDPSPHSVPEEDLRQN